MRSSSSRTTSEPAPDRWTTSSRRPGVASDGSTASATSRRSATSIRRGRSRWSRPAEPRRTGCPSCAAPPPSRARTTSGRSGSARTPASSAALRRTGSTSSSQPVARRTRAAEAGHTASRAAATCSSVSTSSRWIAATGCTRRPVERRADRGRELDAVRGGQPVRAPGPRRRARRRAARSRSPSRRAASACAPVPGTRAPAERRGPVRGVTRWISAARGRRWTRAEPISWRFSGRRRIRTGRTAQRPAPDARDRRSGGHQALMATTAQIWCGERKVSRPVRRGGS